MLDPRSYPFIGVHEGKVLKAYRCPAGVITIGYGFTMGSKIFAAIWREKHGRGLRLGDVISAADAMMLLRRLVDSEYAEPVERLAAGASPHAKGAAASMLYNCGLGAAKWRWFQMLARGLPSQAARLVRTTATTARGRRLPGLVRRRAEEADIMEFNRWPVWLKADAPARPGPMLDVDIKNSDAAAPMDDCWQGMEWLKALGYWNGDAAMAPRTAAIKRFQSDHRQLTVDGILGRATLDQLQRVMDLKRKGKATGGSGAVVSGAGAADKVADASGYADFALYGGLAFAVIGCAVLAWMYRDELKIALKKGVS